MFKPGQKVIVKKTGEIGVIKNKLIADIYYVPIEYNGMFYRSFYHESEIHPIKFDVGEFVETKLKYAENIFGEIVEIKYNKELDTIEYQISVKDPENNNHGIFIFYENNLEKLEKVEQPDRAVERAREYMQNMIKNNPSIIDLIRQAEEAEKIDRALQWAKENPPKDNFEELATETYKHCLEIHDRLKNALEKDERPGNMSLVYKFPQDELEELLKKYDHVSITFEREKEEMQEPKFKNGEKVVWNNADKKTDVIVIKSQFQIDSSCWYLIESENQCRDWVSENNLEKIEKPKFKYPDLVMGKKYNLSNGVFNLYEFMGYENGCYKFKNENGAINTLWIDDRNLALKTDNQYLWPGEITEHVEPKKELVQPEKLVLQSGKKYKFSRPDYPQFNNPFTFIDNRGDKYYFTNANGKEVWFVNLDLQYCSEYKEPYSKDFWVCIDPNGECDRSFKGDDITDLCTTGGIHKTEQDAAAEKHDGYTQIKKFRVTEVV